MKWYEMPGGEDFLMAPVLAGLCRYESLKDGTLDLHDIAVMNDALAVRHDNEALAQQREKERHGQ